MAMAAILTAMIFSSTQEAEARGRDANYRNLISRHCVAVPHDRSEWFTHVHGHIDRTTVQIQDVRSLSRNWVRVYAIGQSTGRVAVGHMDYNVRNGAVRCPKGSFIYNHLPLWKLFRD